ncbi:hypothetical protein NDU88_007303 [Pleurodeles waltl]|uniref:Uncharacterized protein n=1 Tax=Pleurodeles waltl TaxID=8319 RepID=A0AAV7MG27_PLEWA|nr:hypothetical protein NDU88_007303 [Pleurodeles waltl]
MESGSTGPIPRRYGPETAVSRALAPWSLAQPAPSPEDTALDCCLQSTRTMESGSTGSGPRRYRPETAVSRALAQWSLAQPAPAPEDTALRPLSPERSHPGVWLNQPRPQKKRP